MSTIKIKSMKPPLPAASSPTDELAVESARLLRRLAKP
jgi:hypothetical protein